MYREEFKVFNEIGNRLRAFFFQDKPPLDNVAVLLAAHSMFSGLPLIDAAEGIAGRHNTYLVCKSSSRNSAVERCNFILVGCDTAPITPPMYDRMHENTILATVTSPDDALDIQTLIRGGHIVREEQQPDGSIPITTYRTRQNHHIHLICDGDAPNLKYSAFGADDPTLAMPLILHAAVGYEMAQGCAVSSERIGQLERQMMSHYLRIYQAVAAETEDYWRGRLR